MSAPGSDVKTPEGYFPTLAAAASVASLAALASYFYTGDPDIYWHMATARAAIAARSLLPVDPFSFSVAGTPWHHKDLLAETIFYFGFVKLGYAWFATLKFLAILSVASLLGASVPRASRGPLLLVAMAGLLVQSFLFIEQPALFSIVLFAATLAIEEAAWERSADPPRLGPVLGAWVALNFAWTWLHRFSVLGHAMIFAWAALLLASRWASAHPAGRLLFGPRAPARSLKVAALAAIASPLVALANPSGIYALSSGSTMAAHPELRQQFWEWKRAGLAELWSAFPVALVVTAAAALWMAARLAVALRRRDEECPVRAWHLLLGVTLTAMTLDSVRWLPYLAMVSLAVVARLLGPEVLAVPPSRRAVLLPLLGLAMVAWYGFARREVPYALGEDPGFAPRGAVAFARKHGLAGPIANTFDLGGYLLWTDPDAKVLVDGRNELVYPPDFVVRCLLAEHDAPTFAAMRAADGVTWALGVNTPEQPGFAFLASDPLWSMVYWSDTAAVYVRRDAHPELEALRYRFVDPYDPVRSVLGALRTAASPETTAAIGREVHRMLVASPASPRALIAQALYNEAPARAFSAAHH